MAGTVEQKLAEQGIKLHEAPTPVANYVPFVRTGNFLVVSGQLCLDAEGKLLAKGKLGAEVSVEDGQKAARAAAMNTRAESGANCSCVRPPNAISNSFSPEAAAAIVQRLTGLAPPDDRDPRLHCEFDACRPAGVCALPRRNRPHRHRGRLSPGGARPGGRRRAR